jgi:Replicase family/Primase C terminal 1 (PriCT-1)
MIFSISNLQSQATSQKYVKNSFVDRRADCTEIAREWFNWDDNDASPSPWSPEQLELNAAILNDDKDAERLALRKLGLLNDVDTLSMLADKCGDDLELFWTNKSSWTYEKLQAHYVSRIPSVLANKDDPQIFCGYHHEKRSSKSVVKGIFCRFNNIRSIPCGYDTMTGGYSQDTPPLPRLLAFDIDRNIFGAEKPADIFEAHVIARPFFTSENPVSGHCHAVYEVKYNAEEWIDWKRTSRELDAITKELTRLIGADPTYNGHVIRSPWFITGFHKNKPASDTGNLINTNTSSTYHKSTFYQPHAYTLTELRELIVYLKTLHGENVSSPEIKVHPRAAVVPTASADTNSRNVSIFNATRRHAYTIAHQYSRNSFDAFVDVLMAYASRHNSFSTKQPLPAYELRATCKSIAGFCLTKSFQRPRQRCDHSSELQSLRSRRRWGYNYETNKMKATANGISESTFYRRQRIENARKSERCARAIIGNLIKTFGVSKSVQSIPMDAYIPLIKKGYCHAYDGDCEQVANEARGPPDD